MSCYFCRNDPHPEHFSDPRRCAFDDSGVFTSDNWNCALIEYLLRAACDDEVEGNDESLQLVPATHGDHGGWLVFTRYKHRGCTSSLVWVGDFYPPRLVTLAMALRRATQGTVREHEDGDGDTEQSGESASVSPPRD